MHAEVMQTIDDIQHLDDDSAILKLMFQTIGQYGFERFIISGLPDRGQDVRPFVLLSGWPDEWYSRYTNLGYVHLDPVARNCFTTTLPFDWQDAHYDRESDLPARRVMDEATDFGMNNGLCIPIHMEGGMQGVVSLVGETGDLDDVARLELHMLALYAHGRLRFIHSTGQNQRPRRAITQREAEVLKWAACGKTASEIAIITGVTERTVNQHCLNAQTKLGTRNRTHSVVEAIRHKLIAL